MQSKFLKPAVFFDRDGVLNESIVRDNQAFGPLTLDQFRIFDYTAPQVRRLKEAGYLCIVFTNQPDVARGILSPMILNEMHNVLKKNVDLDDLFVCLHEDKDDCLCRKPKPGMILEAAKKWNVNLSQSFAIGDRWRDIDAGNASGCRTILVERPYSRCETADFSVSHLVEAVDIILREQE